MSDSLYLGLVALGGSLGLILCTWKTCSCLARILDSTNRSVERERRDYIQLLEKLLEKRDVLPQHIPDLAALHAQERIGRVAEDARTDVASIPKAPTPKNNSLQGKPDIVNTDGPVETAEGMF